MDNCRILITGDYWHDDFRDFVTQFNSPVTMIPQEQIGSAGSLQNFDLVILAESRRGQMDRKTVETLQKSLPTSPMVSLLGSWCEGEQRSGDAIPGVVRVYWHQWEGRYKDFLNALSEDKVANWALPATANESDRIQAAVPAESERNLQRPHFLSQTSPGMIGVSTRKRESYEMLADAVSTSDWNAFWIEQSSLPASRMPEFRVICIEADSVSDEIERRVSQFKKAYPMVPIIAVLNFPRVDDAYNAQSMGIHRVVSKPFQLVDLNHAINSVIGKSGSEVA